MKLVALLIAGILTQAEIDDLMALAERAEAARIEQFYKKLACTRIVKQDTLVIVCVKDLEIFTLEEPLVKLL